nr:MAG TPA_asm: PRKC APOPTOSIS WT1 REGULATOR PROTEIN [Caudoviricetes sp.]
MLMNEYIFKGDPKHLENVIREQRIRIQRGVVSITTPSESGYITQEESEQKVQAKEDELNAVISEKDSEIGRLNTSIGEKDARIKELEEQIAGLQKQTEEMALCLNSDPGVTDNKATIPYDTKESESSSKSKKK